MKKLLISIIVLLLIQNVLYSQEHIAKTLYASYYGNVGTDDADVVTVDPMGNIYLGCHSTSKNLPGTPNHSYKLKGGMDAFIIKLDNQGTKVDYLTHLGGGKWDAIQGIVSDSKGNIYAVGTTYSSDFPIKSNAFQSKFGGKSDAFVVKLNPKGKVVWSTFLGGKKDEDGRGIVIDKQNNIHVIGRTASKNFPTTNNAIQPESNGGIDAFVTSLDTNGNVLASTYLGGAGNDIGFAIKSDSIGQLYIGGTTNSINFPLKNPIQSRNKGEDDAFLAVIDPTKSVIKFASYFGGNKVERLYSVDLDASGNVFIMGFTNSSDYPTTDGAYQPKFAGERDVFVTKLNLEKRKMEYSTYIGGKKDDNPRNLAIDEKGNAFIIGYTGSNDFPIVNSQKTYIRGSKDAFMTKLDVKGAFLHDSRLFGGNGDDFFEGLAIGTNGTLTVSGGSNSTDFPLVNPLQNTFLGGRFDIIVARFSTK
ncbi:SBBP repeat-containing protein [uncultured Tenacibaculum sp.]|uniref:SBBP repeat-containing protein n=1 Tax=uncultured Tenacibaculum sp. TaxID=174713 RepID=UPI00260B07EB|nr:SBBP repeat-containing protein [uncultured Tenacibaculum sp.]